MGISAVIFYEKSEKTDILLTYLAHNILCYFDRIDFIWTKYGHGSRGFLMKKLKKRHKSTVFLREWTFWENMGMRALWFLEKWRFFTKYGHESRVCFLENGRFFKQIWAWEQLFFVKNRKKLIPYRLFSPYFRETGSFFDKIWAWEYCVFIEIRHFLTSYKEKNSYFSVKDRKRRASYWLIGPKIYCSFDRIYVSLPNKGLTAESFSLKIETKWHESTVFWENGHFLDKIWAWEHCGF